MCSLGLVEVALTPLTFVFCYAWSNIIIFLGLLALDPAGECEDEYNLFVFILTVSVTWFPVYHFSVSDMAFK